MGIHYDYKSKRGERAMLKEAKRKARLAQRRMKRLLSAEPAEKEEAKTQRRAKRLSSKQPLEEKEEVKTHDIGKTITLDDLTNPNQK